MVKKENKATPTRKVLVGLERERYFNRLLLIATIIILGLVVGLIGWGATYESLILPRRAVAIVEGEEILGSEYALRAQVNRQNVVDTYVQYYQSYQMFGGEDTFGQQLLQEMYQLQLQLDDPAIVGSQTIAQMVDDRLLELEAQEREIIVSDGEIEQQLEELFGYYRNGLPTATTIPTLVPTSTLSAQQLALVSPTPTALITNTSTVTTTEGAEDVEPSSTPTSGPSPTPFPTATPITQAGYETQLADYLELQQQELGLKEDDLRELIRISILRDIFFEIATEGVESVQEQVWARHILVADEATANEILGRLDDGEDWTALASEYSLDTSNASLGGDLGWFDTNMMVEEFSNAAFELRIGQISDPVESDFGFHIIQKLGHEERALSNTQLTSVRQQAFQAFVEGLREKYDYEIHENVWRAIAPDDPDIPINLRLATQ